MSIVTNKLQKCTKKSIKIVSLLTYQDFQKIGMLIKNSGTVIINITVGNLTQPKVTRLELVIWQIGAKFKCMYFRQMTIYKKNNFGVLLLCKVIMQKQTETKITNEYLHKQILAN